ncbi:hypothetical protein HOLleu_44254 [Holothuria leucospilota]|uniref:DUF7041 domain-containing protein n=1 Tax=Holothuria leucospilota TaxID=206669 RepID=A0A9Q0YCN4_HOLLE|nr:hypothetical protein HOLleu_44254 [Holothuria leucospilota]
MTDDQGTSKKQGQDVNPNLAAVSIKLPPFWPKDPTIWFAQVEAQFTTRGITSQSTKFAYVVASLQPEIAEEVRDLLITPPEENPYDKIKTQLIERTSTSEQKRLHQLLISEELGDRKPSQLLRRRRQLLGERQLEDSIFKTLFLQRLPTNVQLILASTRDTVDIEQLSLIADKVLEVTPNVSSVAAITKSSPPPANVVAANFSPSIANSSSEIDELRSLVSKLTTKVDALTDQLAQRSRGRSRDRAYRGKRQFSRSRSKSRPRFYEKPGGYCWYHFKFGKKAEKCIPPCSYGKSGEQGNNKASD